MIRAVILSFASAIVAASQPALFAMQSIQVDTNDTAVDHNENSTAEAVTLLIRKMRSQRKLLRSGVFEFSGTWSVNDVTSEFAEDDIGHEFSGSFGGRCGFDMESDSFRFDGYKEQLGGDIAPRIADPGAITTDLLKSIPLTRRTVILNSCRNEDYVAWWSSGSPTSGTSLMILPPHKTGVGISTIPRFDARALGLFSLLEFRTGDVFSLHDAVEALLANSVSVMEEGPNGVSTIRFKDKAGTAGTIDVDTKKGFVPVSCHAVTVEGIPLQASVKWVAQGGTHVPTNVSIGFTDFPEEGCYERYVFSLKWSNVNQPIASEMFTYEDFPDVRNGTSVFDDRGAQPIWIGQWKDGR